MNTSSLAMPRSFLSFGLSAITRAGALSWFMAALFCIYAGFFWQSVAQFWFHPGWTTDDGLQQLYPLYEVLHPGRFEGDLVTEVMRGYLPPLHYWISAAFTHLTGSPIMAGHWVHLLQLSLSLLFLFVAVRRFAGAAPAWFACAWLLHTRYVMQRLTAGLPRGWALVVLLAFLAFWACKRHRLVLATLFAGCLLHPPSTLVAATSYGLGLLWDSFRARKIQAPLRELIIISPLCAVVTLLVVARPDHIGPMVGYQEALSMPEFSRPRGRFPFVPLNPVGQELYTFAFQAFVGRLYNPGPFLRQNAHWLAILLVVIPLSHGALRRYAAIPRELLLYLVGVFTVYAASRLLAFKLYVPDRHIQFPMAVFFIMACTIGFWRMATATPAGERPSAASLRAGALALLLLGGTIFLLSGSGLRGTANFNYASTKRGGAFAWIQRNTPTDALIAGDPTHIDPTQLFAIRKAYITTETAHPFYPVYNREVRRRLEISLQAHYAKTLEEFSALVVPEKISYFVFRHASFSPEALARATYFVPFESIMREVQVRPLDQFVYHQLAKLAVGGASPVVFSDQQSLVVDVEKLSAFMRRSEG